MLTTVRLSLLLVLVTTFMLLSPGTATAQQNKSTQAKRSSHYEFNVERYRGEPRHKEGVYDKHNQLAVGAGYAPTYYGNTGPFASYGPVYYGYYDRWGYWNPIGYYDMSGYWHSR